LARWGTHLYWPAVEIQHMQSSSVKKESPFRIRRIRYLDMLSYLKAHYGTRMYLAFLPITYLSIAAWWVARLARPWHDRFGVRE